MNKLFYKYLTPLLILSTIPLMIVSMMIYLTIKHNMDLMEENITQQSSANLQKEISLKNEAIATKEGDQIAAEIDRIFYKTTTLASAPVFRELYMPDLNEYINQLMNNEPTILEFYLVDISGKVLIRRERIISLETRGEEDFSGSPFFKTILGGDFYVSEVDIYTSSDKPIVWLGIPILSYTNNVNGGILVKVDLGFLWNVINSFPIEEGGSIYIISANGRLITHSNKKELYQNPQYNKYDYIQEILKKKHGTILNNNKIISFATNKYNWTTIIEIPVDVALASVYTNKASIEYFISDSLKDIFLITILILLIVMALSAATGIYITKIIVKPIEILTDASRKISSGDLSIRIHTDREDEIGELTRAFNQMTEQLQKDQEALKKAAEYTRKQAKELKERYNSDLEQFARIATHDLMEPLRMINSYIQLLQKRYNHLFDENAREFMQYILEGATRMHRIVSDLFEYAHIRTDEEDFEEVDLHHVFDIVINNLDKEIRESNANITCRDLPKIKAVEPNMVQLFQNLIANAIKFRSDRPLEILIDARENGQFWEFSVKDNGIGMDPKYSDKIFEIFKRLHTKDEYPGSGMGLAICKNIVERHGGRIWVESQPGKGSTFKFTIPKK